MPIVLYACTPLLESLNCLDTLHYWRGGMLHNGAKHYGKDAVGSNAQVMQHAVMPCDNPPAQEELLSFDGCTQHI